MTFEKKNKNKIIIIIAIIVVIVIGLAIWLGGLFVKRGYKADFRKLNIPLNSSLKPFGDKILYIYEGMLYCCTDNGTTIWSYDVGDGAQVDCDNNNVVVWRKSNVYVLDAKGHSSYSDNLGQDIIFARINKQYFGVVIGDERKSRLSIYDLKGTQIDEESTAFRDSLILDFGFFGRDGEYMWTLKLETDATAPNSVLNTFEVGKMNTGEVSLGDYFTYSVLFDNGNLNIINTRRMLSYDYRVSKQTRPSLLLYGWKMLDSIVYDDADAYILFVPLDQKASGNGINELRLVSGKKDRRYTLPVTAVSAFLSDKNLYAVAGNTIYKASINDTGFASFPINMKNGISKHIATLSNGKAIVSDEQDVYTITLP